MRIDLNITGAQGSNQAPRTNQGKEPANSAARTTEDAARFSSGRTSVHALSAAVQQMPEIRQERVAALAEMIKSGNYKVDSAQVAGALITQTAGPNKS